MIEGLIDWCVNKNVFRSLGILQIFSFRSVCPSGGCMNSIRDDTFVLPHPGWRFAYQMFFGGGKAGWSMRPLIALIAVVETRTGWVRSQCTNSQIMRPEVPSINPIPTQGSANVSRS